MYKLIGSALTIFFSIGIAKAQVSSKATISVTIVNPVGVEMEESSPGNAETSRMKIIGTDQSYSITVWNGEKFVDLQKNQDKDELIAVKTRVITVNFE